MLSPTTAHAALLHDLKKCAGLHDNAEETIGTYVEAVEQKLLADTAADVERIDELYTALGGWCWALARRLYAAKEAPTFDTGIHARIGLPWDTVGEKLDRTLSRLTRRHTPPTATVYRSEQAKIGVTPVEMVAAAAVFCETLVYDVHAVCEIPLADIWSALDTNS
jgi:hypothetical protein